MQEAIYGGALYLFHPEGKYNNHCVISAHGGYSAGCCGPSTFNIPDDVELVFYSPHGSTVKDFGIENFLSKLHRVVETKTSKDNPCYNYVLTKYQGKHNKAGETYKSIETAVGRNRQMTIELNNIFALGNEFNRRSRGEDRELLLSEAISPLSEDVQFEHPFDVVTVRNRWWRTLNDMTLKKVVEAVLARHKYTTIHCFFCRSLC